jgi:hypothetical protein
MTCDSQVASLGTGAIVEDPCGSMWIWILIRALELNCFTAEQADLVSLALLDVIMFMARAVVDADVNP